MRVWVACRIWEVRREEFKSDDEKAWEFEFELCPEEGVGGVPGCRVGVLGVDFPLVLWIARKVSYPTDIFV